MPALSKWTKRVPPASYRPRSKRLPSKREKTLWKKGSRFGKSTTEPTRTTKTCGSKLLFFWTSCGRFFVGCVAAAETTSGSRGLSQTTTYEEFFGVLEGFSVFAAGGRLIST